MQMRQLVFARRRTWPGGLERKGEMYAYAKRRISCLTERCRCGDGPFGGRERAYKEAAPEGKGTPEGARTSRARPPGQNAPRRAAAETLLAARGQPEAAESLPAQRTPAADASTPRAASANSAGARPYVSVRYGGGRRDAASRAGRRHSPSAAAPHPRCRHVVPWRHEPSPRACSLSDRIMESGADLDSQLIARDVTLMENTSFEVPLTSHVTPVTLLPQPTQFHVGWKLNSTPMEKKAARCNIISYPASSQLHNSHTANINKWSVFALLVI
ncbi:uncharacterized protein LOC126354768 isoform X2 [Schistocerca gregaria]|uniref:uncharacterized protein LOC126354768 isoform X2 n=1 Tax=Schistocerca gregaria TaxID=7010 RepID=UPI00211DA6A4|nr:uncharacterized protein LOC126354768 isoform X2 [Schistocerca gregaria]